MTLRMIRMARPRAFPPRVTAFTRIFWDGLAEGRFQTTCCDACRRLSFPPKPFCPHCWNRSTHWTNLSGNGALYAQSVVHAGPAAFREEAPYRVGIVDLAEGLRVATRILADVPPALGGPMRIVVQLYTDGPLFAAEPGA